MLDVSIRNPLLIKTLNDFARSMLSDTSKDTLDSLHYSTYDEPVDCEEGCSREYLDNLLSKDVMSSGWPRHQLGFDLNTSKAEYIPNGWNDIAKKLDDGIMQSIGVGFSALKMYYPVNGFIGGIIIVTVLGRTFY